MAEFSIEDVASLRSPSGRFEGVAVARAQCLHDVPVGSVTDSIDEAAVLVELSRFEDKVDFVSIGSNDLVQYLTAADRDNPKGW